MYPTFLYSLQKMHIWKQMEHSWNTRYQLLSTNQVITRVLKAQCRNRLLSNKIVDVVLKPRYNQKKNDDSCRIRTCAGKAQKISNLSP